MKDGFANPLAKSIGFLYSVVVKWSQHETNQRPLASALNLERGTCCDHGEQRLRVFLLSGTATEVRAVLSGTLLIGDKKAPLHQGKYLVNRRRQHEPRIPRTGNDGKRNMG